MTSVARMMVGCAAWSVVGCPGPKEPKLAESNDRANGIATANPVPQDGGSATDVASDAGQAARSVDTVAMALVRDIHVEHPDLEFSGSLSHEIKEGALLEVELDEYSQHFVVVVSEAPVSLEKKAKTMESPAWLRDVVPKHEPFVAHIAAFGPAAGKVHYEIKDRVFLVRFRKPVETLVASAEKKQAAVRRQEEAKEVIRVCGGARVTACKRKGCIPSIEAPARRCPGGKAPPPGGFPEDGTRQEPACVCRCGSVIPTSGKCPPVP